MELINRHKKIVGLKSTGTFEEQTRIPRKLNVEETSCRQKRITFEHFLQISIPAELKTKKRSIFQRNTANSYRSWSNQFWNPLANVPVKVQYEKTST